MLKLCFGSSKDEIKRPLWYPRTCQIQVEYGIINTSKELTHVLVCEVGLRQHFHQSISSLHATLVDCTQCLIPEGAIVFTEL
jgi:hypothetical protein